MAASDFILQNTDLFSLFEYRDGKLYWRVPAGGPAGSSGVRKVGDLAGGLNRQGYICLKINNTQVKAHRVIFMMHHGFLPGIIDHIDGNKANNRIENLRAVTHLENTLNSKKPSTNRSGIKGVCWHKLKNKWMASCALGGKIYHVGYFDDIQEAAQTVHKFRENLHGSFANHG